MTPPDLQLPPSEDAPAVLRVVINDHRDIVREITALRARLIHLRASAVILDRLGRSVGNRGVFAHENGGAI